MFTRSLEIDLVSIMITSVVSNITQQYENLETYCLIWLDTSVNELPQNIKAQKELRKSINHLITFEDDQQCIRYIESLSKYDRIIFIVSGKFGHIIVPKIVKYQQIVSIYVYCVNKIINERWSKQFNKVKAVMMNLDKLIYRIHKDQYQRKSNKVDESLSICNINLEDDDHEQLTTDLSEEYLHFQLLIDYLINMNFNRNDKNELISLCKQRYNGNSGQLKMIEEFESKYSSDQVLWWYTRDSFLYQMLNKAFRVENIHILYLFRFIIRDIEQQLEQNKCYSPVHVYRAQLMPNDQVQILKDSIGKFIGINSFFSTSFDRERFYSCFSFDDNSNEMQKILFEIDADPQIEDIKPFSYYPEEQEVIFMIGSVFQIISIDSDQDGLLIVKMNLCSLNTHHIQLLFHQMKKYQNKEKDLLHLADILKNMGKWNDAEKYYHRFLDQLPDNHKNRAYTYDGLASVAKNKGDYESSLNWYNKSLQINIQLLKSDNVNIAQNYNNIGTTHEARKDYVQALESYEKALIICMKAFGEDHLNVATCMNNMGNAYRHDRKYSKALELYKKALDIREKYHPADHPEIGSTHKNIANTYADLGQLDLALSYYKSTLRIYKKSLSFQHPSITTTLRCIGLIYENKCDFQEALSYFEEASKISRPSLSSTHLDIIHIEKDIQRVSSKIK